MAVPLASGGCFLAQIKRGPRLGRGEQPIGLLVESITILRGRAVLDVAGQCIHFREHVAPSLAARETHAFGQIQVAHACRIGADIERGKRAGQITGARRVRVAANGIARYRDVRRQGGAETSFVRHDAAEARKLECGRRTMPGQQKARASVVIAKS